MTLMPGAAFAQHGGGGGAHGGGGGFGGGGHYGGGGFHPSSAPAHAPTSAPANHGNTSASGAGNTANPNGGGHWWNPFHSAPANEKAAATPVHAVTPSTASSFTTVRPAGTGRIFSPVRPVYPYYPYYFYNPYYYGFGGAGFLFGSGFGPCDPFFGCYGGYGFGLGYGYGAGYYGAGYYGGGLFGSGDSGEPGWTYPSSDASGSDSSSGDYTVNAQNGSGDANANLSTGDGTGEAAPSVNTNSPTMVFKDGAAGSTELPAVKTTSILYLKDGSSFAVTDYWLAQGKLHYVTSYGGENTMDLGKLDLQKTVDENAKQGTVFSLKSTPGTAK